MAKGKLKAEEEVDREKGSEVCTCKIAHLEGARLLCVLAAITTHDVPLIATIPFTPTASTHRAWSGSIL